MLAVRVGIRQMMVGGVFEEAAAHHDLIKLLERRVHLVCLPGRDADDTPI